MIFKPMKPEDVRKALEGQVDILTPTAKQKEALFKTLSCPECGGEVMPVVNPKKPFKPSDILPNFLGKCKSCGVEFEPYNGMNLTVP